MAFDTTDAAALAAGPMGLQADLVRKSGLLNTPNVPQAQIAQLDPGTQALLQQQQAKASETPQAVAEEQLRGAQAGGQQFVSQPAQLQRQATALGMAQPADLGAQLQARAQKQFGSSMIGLQNQANMNAANIILKREKDALGGAEVQQELNMQAYNRALGNETAKRKARGQMISSILGIAGLGVGAAMGAPGAGMSAGSGVGNAVAGAEGLPT